MERLNPTDVISGLAGDLQREIDESVGLVREVSMQTDPQEMVHRYRQRMAALRPRDGSVSLSRRELPAPAYRITRATHWEKELNPWKQKDELPLLSGGLFADLVYGNAPRLIDELGVDARDPAHEYLKGFRSLLAIPLFDRGESLNMVVRLMREPNAIDARTLPDLIVTANLFGRATQNLVLAEKLRRAYDEMDAELKTLAAIQRSLLPPAIPAIPGLEAGVYYATAHRAGGDYYDFFPIDARRTGILIADVSGHGAAAAAVMARLHSALHALERVPDRPGRVMGYANDHLLMQCAAPREVITFVTCFYGVFDGATRSMRFASAGHNPPRWRCSGGKCSIAAARNIPLGIECGVRYEEGEVSLEEGDMVLLYTDGIVEAANRSGEQFGVDRVDAALANDGATAQETVARIVADVDRFADPNRAVDDRTLVALRIT